MAQTYVTSTWDEHVENYRLCRSRPLNTLCLHKLHLWDVITNLFHRDFLIPNGPGKRLAHRPKLVIAVITLLFFLSLCTSLPTPPLFSLVALVDFPATHFSQNHSMMDHDGPWWMDHGSRHLSLNFSGTKRLFYLIELGRSIRYLRQLHELLSRNDTRERGGDLGGVVTH